MRKLTFRCWVKKLKIIDDVYVINLGDECVTLTHKFDNKFIFNFNEVELMQFTGSFDSSGNRIFEGDLVDFYIENEKFQGKIKYHGASFWIYWNGQYFIGLDEYGETGKLMGVEITGNIYEGGKIKKILIN